MIDIDDLVALVRSGKPIEILGVRYVPGTDADELQALFDLQWTRMHEATQLWRQYNPGNDLVQPDLGKLLDWLLQQIHELKRTLGILVDMMNEHNPEVLDAYVFMENIEKARGPRVSQLTQLIRELSYSYHSANTSIRDHVDRLAPGWTVGDIATCDDPLCVEIVSLGLMEVVMSEDQLNQQPEHNQSGTEAPAEDPEKLVGGGPLGTNAQIGDDGQEDQTVEPKEPEED